MDRRHKLHFFHCSLGWFFEKKVGRRKNGQVLTYGYMHKECLEKRIWTKSPMARKLAHFNCQGEAISIWRSLGSDFWPRNWKSMWKSYILSIFYKNIFFGLFMIFGTLFSEKCPLLGNFDQNLFLPESSTTQKILLFKNA